LQNNSEKKSINTFLSKLLIEILPRLTSFSGFKIKTTTSAISFKLLSKELVLQELENQYPLFENLPNLDINISTTAQNQKELLFLIKALKIPINKEK
jgi:ribosomal protein L5